MVFFLGFLIGATCATLVCLYGRDFKDFYFPPGKKSRSLNKIYTFRDLSGEWFYITNLSTFYSAYTTIADYRFTLISNTAIYNVISDNGAENGNGIFFKADRYMEDVSKKYPLNKFLRAYRLGIAETVTHEMLLTHNIEIIRNWAKDELGEEANADI